MHPICKSYNDSAVRFATGYCDKTFSERSESSCTPLIFAEFAPSAANFPQMRSALARRVHYPARDGVAIAAATNPLPHATHARQLIRL
jgi:hypothetical protein